jgi:hypothetical protein
MVLDAISTTETHAQMTVADQRAPSSQLGGQGFESPQLHPGHRPFPSRGGLLPSSAAVKCSSRSASEATQRAAMSVIGDVGI